MPKVWYKLSIPEGKSSDGSEYHVYVKKADPEKLCIILSGGGLAWDDQTALSPTTGGRLLAGEPLYYTPNLRPVLQFTNINIGITETGRERNPFDDWSFLVITYPTGDMHIGNAELNYTDEKGEERTLYFHGYKNYRAAMERIRDFIPQPKKLLIAGCSAGAFVVPALAGEILEDFYPECGDVTVIADSGQLLYDRWQEVIRDVWKAEEKFWKPVDGNNAMVSWFRELHEKYGSRLRYLYTSSTGDAILTCYQNSTITGDFKTDPGIRHQFKRDLKEMVLQLHEIDSNFGFFIHGIKNPVLSMGGTMHTILRTPYFFRKLKNGITMADWLSGAVAGEHLNIGVKIP